jgi:hypothetical protein
LEASYKAGRVLKLEVQFHVAVNATKVVYRVFRKVSVDISIVQTTTSQNALIFIFWKRNSDYVVG